MAAGYHVGWDGAMDGAMDGAVSKLVLPIEVSLGEFSELKKPISP